MDTYMLGSIIFDIFIKELKLDEFEEFKKKIEDRGAKVEKQDGQRLKVKC